MSFAPEKPWSVDQFEEFRPQMTEFVRTQISPRIHGQEIRRLLIHGQVKVGKREIVEYTAMRDKGSLARMHVFISAFHRKADACQREELSKHGIRVFSVNQKSERDSAIAFIRSHLPTWFIVIHWDECDYGTGDNQNLADVYRAFCSHPQVFNILYSATPEELLYSCAISSDELLESCYSEGVVVEYDPPEGYCGVKRFLDEGLVEDAHPFFEYSEGIQLSNQAKTILLDAKRQLKSANRERRRLETALEDAEEAENVSEVARIKKQASLLKNRNIIVLRLSYKIGDDDTQRKKAIYPFLEYSQYLKELEDVAIYADKTDVTDLQRLRNVQCLTIEWGKRIFWDNLPKDRIVLIVHDQTSTRSTEWTFHDRVFATHDFRNQVTFNTIIQAQLRSAHYVQNYGGQFQPIRIYGSKRAFQLAAGQITVAEYLNNDWTLRKKTRSNLYLLKSSTNQTALPDGRVPSEFGYPYEQARQILIENGMNPDADIRMAQRVNGTVIQIPHILSEFYPCEPHEVEGTLETIAEDMRKMGIDHSFNGTNLFIDQTEDGRYKGYLRKWDVFEYDAIKQLAWGINDNHLVRLTVCYRDNSVGLCVRMHSGTHRTVSTLETFKSMYQG